MKLKEKRRITERLVRVSTKALRLKRRLREKEVRRKVCEQIHLKQVETCEASVCDSLSPMFEMQIRDAAKRLGEMEEKSWVKTVEDEAESLASQIFDPNEWNRELVDRALPPLARSMAEAIESQNEVMRVDGAKFFGGRGWMEKHLPGQHSQSTHGRGGGGLSDLSKSERDALEDYTTDKFQSINDELRFGDLSKGNAKIVKLMDSGLKKAEKRPGATVRSFDLASGDEGDQIRGMLKEGEVFSDKAYLSTRKKPTVSDRVAFKEKLAPAGRVVLRIEGKNGVDVSEISLNPGEGEVLYPRGSKFRVDKVLELDNGALLAEISEITEKSKSTATEYLDGLEPNAFEDVVFETPLGDVSMQIVTEFPHGVKREIENQLKDTFSQPYWEKVNETTLGDIEGFLRTGIKEGWSVRKMAKEMAPFLLEDGKYAIRRGIRIARTESGHALNGARVAAIDSLAAELGEQIPLKKIWMSVLGSTTRDTHADLDGVPAGKDGKWFLGGVRVPWPSHSNLPAGERISCQCSVLSEFGMTDSEADELIADFELRLLTAQRQFEEAIEKHLPGQHSQSTHGRGRGGLSDTGEDEDGNRILANGDPLPDHIPRIPPAWTDVRVSTDPNAKLIVQGKDAKGRVQSVYSESHTMQQAAAKFARTNELRRKEESIANELRRDMKSDNTRTRENATVLRLIQATGIRPGSAGDTKAEKQAFGATTLEARHIRVSAKGKVRLQFTGKKGVSLNIPVEDSSLASELIRRKDNAGKTGDRIFSTNSGSLLTYSKQKDGGGFKTKDFRTARGTSIALAEKAKMKAPTTKAEYKKSVKQVAKAVSDQLGNTPTVALSAYIDPVVFSDWRGVMD